MKKLNRSIKHVRALLRANQDAAGTDGPEPVWVPIVTPCQVAKALIPIEASTAALREQLTAARARLAALSPTGSMDALDVDDYLAAKGDVATLEVRLILDERIERLLRGLLRAMGDALEAAA